MIGGFERLGKKLAEALNVPGVLVELVEQGWPVVAAVQGGLPASAVQDLLRLDRAGRGDDILLLEDARLDPRLAGHPIVAAAKGVRFLAVAPLARPDGEIVGTLAAYGSEPRPGNADDRAVLRRFTGLMLDYIDSQSATEERRQIEERVAASRDRYRSVIDSLSEVIFQIDFQGRWRFLNRAWTRLTDEEVTEALGERALLRAVPEDRRGLLELFRDLRQGKIQTAEREFRYASRDGSPRWAELIGFLAQDEVQGIPVVTGTLKDVTERHETEATRRAAREATDRANRARAEFLATVSHEIRTPINGVIGMTGLLLDTNLSPEQWRYASSLRASAEHLLQIINDILDYSKIDAGKLEFEHVRMRMSEIVDSVVAITAPKAGAKGIELSSTVPPALPHNLMGDPGRLRQILLNLVGNAIKFTDHGSVAVEIEIRGEDERRAELVMIVTDTGVGIPAEALPLLFAEFSQVDSSVSRRFGGTGLGLAICKRLLDGMGGRIEVESAVGIGSMFRCTVPLEKDMSAGADDPVIEAETAVAGFALKGRVLVAEDNPANQLIIAAVLDKYGLRVDLVSNGVEAVNAVRTLPYDLVLMDMQMPEMDGLQATLAIRRLGGKASTIPIIGVTANAFKEDHDRCREAGMQDIVTKPFRWTDLAKRMARWMPSDQPDHEGVELMRDLAVGSQPAFDKLISEVGEEAALAITEVFLRDSRSRVGRLVEHGETRDVMGLSREAHALKGSVDMLGFERLTLISSMLEMAGKEDAPAEEIARHLAALKTEFAEVEQLCLKRLGRGA
ncbi:MAG TPA: ATP-binding protein [Aliidongia sp.]|nr:ATP-binding protein [Aliidongia sp.]